MEYSENFSLESETSPKLAVELQKLAERFPIQAKQLTPEETPKIEPQEGVGPKLETAYLETIESKRLLFYGDKHGLLFPFLNEAVKKE